MHGLINRSFESFLKDTYGQTLWHDVADRAEVPRQGFEALLTYQDALSETMIQHAMELLGRPRDALLEDFGIYLVSHPTTEALRRLMRFGGATFAEFIQSLDELPDRARLALPDLDLPCLDLRDNAPGSFSLTCRWHFPGAGHVVVGVLRTMADDYGALVLLEHVGSDGAVEVISIDLLEQDFSQGRAFHLAAQH